jgi:hypothetical protein
MTQSALYSEHHATKALLDLKMLGLASWEPQDVISLQVKIGALADGWFGPKSIQKYHQWVKDTDTTPAGPAYDAGCVLLGNVAHKPPQGLRVVNHMEPVGVPARQADTRPRAKDYVPTQFLLHRGAETKRAGENYAQATERVLRAKGCSTTFTLDVDGIVYQHYDPAERHGIHCTHHNVQSDSLDIGGPFSRKHKPVPGQTELALQMAIGRKNDGKPPLTRRYAPVRCWSMTPAQRTALALFVPWYCQLRGIPARACSDWRTFRIGGLGTRDPATHVRGIVAHTQVAGPGTRVDGILPLHHLLEDGVVGVGSKIQWRDGEGFWDA